MATLVERRGDAEHRVRREACKWGDQWKQLRMGEQERENQRFVGSGQGASGGLVEAQRWIDVKSLQKLERGWSS